MMPVHDDLLMILDAVEIVSRSRYVLLGEPRDLPDVVGAESSQAVGPTLVAAALADDLYERLYLRPSPPPHAPSEVLAGRDFQAALSRANSGRGHWESGWSVRRVAVEGQIVVARDGIEFWVPATGVHVESGSIRSGENCRVWVAKEMRSLLPGHYVAIGDEASEADHDRVGPDPLVRFYWHLRSDAAARFVATATSLLNESRIPFQLKVLRHPYAYHRADAGVLYLRRRCRSRVEAVIGQIHAAVDDGLRPEVPLFTRRLARGLGYAEDPDGSSSFGQHRCQLVAESLCQSFLVGEVDRDRRADALASVFLRAGLDPRRPHLGPGSGEDDDPPSLSSDRATGEAPSNPDQSRETFKTGSSRPAPVSLLDAAIRIGRSLCRSAYWDREGRLCNWIGRSTDEVAAPGGQVSPASTALGPDLYMGSAGIALFLAQLDAAIGDDEFRRTSRAAIARSIRQLAISPVKQPLSPLSFFGGDLGVAYLAWSVGRMTQSDEILTQAGSILERVFEAFASPHMFDVIGGSAGAIPALLAMGETPGLERCQDLAIALGEELDRAELWRTDAPSAEGDSTTDEGLPSGFSHGAAGIGLSLFELYAATGRLDFREAARRAFEFEDTLFEPRQGNWADRRRRSGRTRFESAWCNGAPGIALARLRAAALDPERREEYFAMARVGFASTRDAIERRLASPRCDATPCHGLGGLIEILSIAGQILDESSYRDCALDAARGLIARHSETGDWPSGLYSGGPNPSLMLGIAGIGYTLLRMNNPDGVPSILLLVS
jgi:lantibiotic biosynthesis protein